MSRQEVVGPEVSLDFAAMDIRHALDHQVSFPFLSSSSSSSAAAATALLLSLRLFQRRIYIHIYVESARARASERESARASECASERRGEKDGWDASDASQLPVPGVQTLTHE